jgi:hypothetical protein
MKKVWDKNELDLMQQINHDVVVSQDPIVLGCLDIWRHDRCSLLSACMLALITLSKERKILIDELLLFKNRYGYIAPFGNPQEKE